VQDVAAICRVIQLALENTDELLSLLAQKMTDMTPAEVCA
jgi:hypothetical protein